MLSLSVDYPLAAQYTGLACSLYKRENHLISAATGTTSWLPKQNYKRLRAAFKGCPILVAAVFKHLEKAKVHYQQLFVPIN